MVVNEAAVREQLEKWIRANKEEIVRAYCRKSDWDLWLQTALARLFQMLPGRPAVEAKPRIGENGSQMTELLIRGSDGSSLHIELKCESAFASSESARARRGELSPALFRADVRAMRWRRSARGKVMGILIAVSEEARSSIQAVATAYGVRKASFAAADDWTPAVYCY